MDHVTTRKQLTMFWSRESQTVDQLIANHQKNFPIILRVDRGYHDTDGFGELRGLAEGQVSFLTPRDRWAHRHNCEVQCEHQVEHPKDTILWKFVSYSGLTDLAPTQGTWYSHCILIMTFVDIFRIWFISLISTVKLKLLRINSSSIMQQMHTFFKFVDQHGVKQPIPVFRPLIVLS